MICKHTLGIDIGYVSGWTTIFSVIDVFKNTVMKKLFFYILEHHKSPIGLKYLLFQDCYGRGASKISTNYFFSSYQTYFSYNISDEG